MRCIVLAAFMVAMVFNTTAVHAQNVSADANVESYQNFSPTFEGGESKRNMPGGILPGLPHLPSNFGQPLMTHEFLSIAKFAEAKLEWTHEDIHNWSEESDYVEVDVRGRSTRSSHRPSDRLKLVMEKPERYEFIGFIQANTNREDTPMEAVFSRLAMTGLDMGANVLVPLNEGAKRVVSASAWGVSLGFTQVTIAKGSERAAGAGAVGVGYAKGQSAYRHEPFARVMAIRISPRDYERLGSPVDREAQLEMENKELKEEIRGMQFRFHQLQRQQQQQK